MKLESFRWIKRQITYRQPMRFGNYSSTSREIFLIELRMESGATGIGEAAPLAGWNNDSDEQIESELVSVSEYVNTNRPVLQDETVFGKYAVRSDNWFPKSPALQFAFSTALLDAAGKERNCSISKLLNPNASASIPLSFLLTGTTVDEVVKTAKFALQQGYTTFKYKLLSNLDDNIELLSEIAGLSENVKIRIDGNEQMQFAEVFDLANRASGFPLEYIEQPIDRNRKNELLQLIEKSPIPIALDESIAGIEEREWWLERAPQAVFIVKPMVMGSVDTSISLCRRIAQAGGKVILSSAMDSLVANAMYLQLAAGLNLSDAMGIGTQTYLENDVVENAIEVNHGIAHIPKSPGLGVTLLSNIFDAPGSA